MLWIALPLALMAGGLWTIYKVAPVWLLDRLDWTIGGNQGTKRVAQGLSFGTQPRLKLDIWAPRSKAAIKRPVLIFYYGGGWHWGERDHYGFVGRAFASRGFIVVIPDYRLVPEAHFPDFVEDSAAAAKWVKANIGQYGGDPDRIAVAGHSAGAYNALMLALDPQWLGDEVKLKAAISLSGPADFYPFDKPNSINAMGKAPDPLATQPITFVRSDAPPLLLMHGSADTTVRIRNAISLNAKQKAAGGEVILRRFEGEDHNGPLIALTKIFRNRNPVLDEAVAFLNAKMDQKESDNADPRRRISDPSNP